MLKIALTATATAALIVVSQLPASARICARICQGGVCWTDCSKIPGQTRLTAQVTAQANASIKTTQPQSALRRSLTRR
jgi:hypothetical protein